jgi:hypothetical protein
MVEISSDKVFKRHVAGELCFSCDINLEQIFFADSQPCRIRQSRGVANQVDIAMVSEIKTPPEFTISRHQRSELMVRLTDMFVNNTQAFDDASQQLFGDIVLSVLDKLDEDTRQELSGRLAMCPQTPPGVAQGLAADELIRIARPMLENSPILPDRFLQQIAEDRSDEYLIAVAKRPTVSTLLSAQLIRNGGPDVHTALVRNPASSITQAGYGKILSFPFDTIMHRALSFRADMPPDVIAQVASRLPANERQRLSRFAGQAEALKSSRRLEKKSTQIHNPFAETASVEEMLRAIKSETATIDDVIHNLVDNNRPMNMSRLLAQLSRRSDQYLQEVFFKSDAEPLQQVCKAIPVGIPGFEALARMRAQRRRLGSAQISREVDSYRKIIGTNAVQPQKNPLLKAN